MRPPLRILWQNEHYLDARKGGGGSTQTYYIATALERLGHEVTILARAVPSAPAGNGTRVLQVQAPAMPDALWPLWPVLEPRYLRRTVADVARAFDAFVCVDAAYALQLKTRRPTARLVYQVEGTRQGYDAAVRAARAPRPRTPREVKRRLLRWLMRLQHELLERLAWRRADAIVVPSEFMERELRELYGVAAGKIHRVPSGVDHDRFGGATAGRDMLERLGSPGHGRVVITFCGRLVPMKNLPYLLQGVARMRCRERAVLVIAGEGELRGELEAEAQRLGLGADVRFLGHLRNVEQLLAASDVFVLPSTYEPFGNALAEAMAAGLPCLALRPDGERVRVATTDKIVDGETGYLLDARDPGSLAARLDVLASDPDLRARLGRAGQARCRAQFSWERCAHAYARLAGGVPRESR